VRQSLLTWIADADAAQHIEHFRVQQVAIAVEAIRARGPDYYITLVGELFDLLRGNGADAEDWPQLGNAFHEVAAASPSNAIESDRSDAALFSATAFYCGGFPASAYLAMQTAEAPRTEMQRICYDLLARPKRLRSDAAHVLLRAVREGDVGLILEVERNIEQHAAESLFVGPEEWIPAKIAAELVKQFRNTNVRSVLPEGESDFWNALVTSFLGRRPRTWDFFPSQIQAIRQGLLDRPDTFTLQMPTGAGKTALCETLLYSHLMRNEPEAAVLLVPYRSLASELRGTVVKRLNQMGLSARCAYGGTVPHQDEVQELDTTRAIVATPEALSGLLSAAPDFLRRVSLIVCDEGHLLDAPGGRGVGLELLLARLKGGRDLERRFVFVSAIVPNVEEINAWLGGTDDTVVRSNYQPATAEFAVLRPSATRVDLEMHAHDITARYTIAGFLERGDFEYTNPRTGRQNKYDFNTVKTQAIATARKTLPMGPVAVFAANKRGNQGAVGLAEELLNQLGSGLRLPRPSEYMREERVAPAIEYTKAEYGDGWIGALSLEQGAVLHHGDIPQETREVFETLVRDRDVHLTICTSTLAEGVNLPIRSLILYSVQRRARLGASENMLTRDIKNLVGRTGRAGAATKGLVICANENQWTSVRQVARGTAGEPVTGALRSLIEQVRRRLAGRRGLSNSDLEDTPALHTLIDGIDTTLIDLAAEEIGQEELARIASEIVEDTFASRQLGSASLELLHEVFQLRSRKISEVQAAGRLRWIKETGTRVRLLQHVEERLRPARERWDNIDDPLNPELREVFINWCWSMPEFKDALKEGFRLEDDQDTDVVRDSFSRVIEAWIAGDRYVDIAGSAELSVDDLLGLLAKTVTYSFQTIVEQGVKMLEKLLQGDGLELPHPVLEFAEHLRFGVPTAAALDLAQGGVRHRRAAVQIGAAPAVSAVAGRGEIAVFEEARLLLETNPLAWRRQLGSLVYDNSVNDVVRTAEEDRDVDN
jgi:helicase